MIRAEQDNLRRGRQKIQMTHKPSGRTLNYNGNSNHNGYNSDENINDEWTAQKTALLGLVVPSKKEYLGFVAGRSEYLCGQFLAGLQVAANGSNTGLDMMTTVFSALGTAFTPLALVHAMTAGATISSGWKTAIDSDVYAKMAVQNIIQTLQSTYYKDMKNYLDALPSLDENNLVLFDELRA